MPVFSDGPFTAASASIAGCVARFSTFPLDVARSKLEKGLGPPGFGTFGMMKEIVRKRGIRGLFEGCVGKLINQMVSSGICIGGYDNIKTTNFENTAENPHGLNIAARICAGAAVGATVTFYSAPKQKHHKSIITTNINEAIRKYREEYAKTQRINITRETINKQFKKSVANVLHNGFINVAEVVSYDIFKDSIIGVYKMKEDIKLYTISAVLCAFTTVLATSPLYSIRNSYYSPPKKYQSVKICVSDMYRIDGVRAFYPRIGANIFRMLLFNIILWNTYEKLKSL